MNASREPRKFFVTRHPGALTWAREGGVKAFQVESEDFDVDCVGPGDVVMGTLPVHLAAQVCRRGGQYWHLAMEVPPSRRGVELTAGDMRAYGARLEAFLLQSLGPRLANTAETDALVRSRRPVLHVCIATGEVMANLLPLTHLEWTDVAVIVTDGMQHQATHLQLLVAGLIASRGNAKGRVVQKKLQHVAPLSRVRAEMDDIAQVLRADFPEHDVIVNWTGGLKLMSQAVLDAFRPFARLFYCHTDEDSLEAVWPPSDRTEPLPPGLTNVHTYLLAHGYRITRQQDMSEEDIARIQDRQRLSATLMLASNRFKLHYAATPDKWEFAVQALHKLATSAIPVEGRRGSSMRPFVPRQVVAGLGQLPTPTKQLLAALAKQQVLEGWSFDGNNLTVEFASESAARYLGGGYAEEFVLLSMLSLDLPPGHVASNVSVDVLNPLMTRKSPELNELDTVLVWRNRILLLECKAGVQMFLQGKSQDALNKLTALRSVVGRFGEAWLISKLPLTADRNADVLDRMGLQRIRPVAGAHELARLPELLRKWTGDVGRGQGLDWNRELLPFAMPRQHGTFDKKRSLDKPVPHGGDRPGRQRRRHQPETAKTDRDWDDGTYEGPARMVFRGPAKPDRD